MIGFIIEVKKYFKDVLFIITNRATILKREDDFVKVEKLRKDESWTMYQNFQILKKENDRLHLLINVAGENTISKY